jgi:hypothetical protein
MTCVHQEQGCKRIAIIRPELQDTESLFFYIHNYVGSSQPLQ